MTTPLRTKPERLHTNNVGVLGMTLTEFWERFSFYGLQGILPFYLFFSSEQGGLEFSPAAAAGVTAAYGGAIYLAQLVGAWMGDRLVSPKRLVFWGGVIITVGHIALAFVPDVAGLTLGLVLIIAGTGALKTNITTIVGFVVAERSDAERDAGFSYFYLGISCGSVFGPLITGFTQNEWGFHLGFGLAAIGMGLALVQYVVSSRRLPARASVVNNPLPRNKRHLPVLAALSALALVALSIWLGLSTAENLATIMMAITIVAAAVSFAVILSSKSVTQAEKQRTAAYIPLFIASAIYFGFLFQAFTAAPILIEESVDLRIGEWNFPVGWVVTFASLSGVIVLPLVAVLWKRLGDRQPKASAKFAIGLAVIASGFLFLCAYSTLSATTQIPLLVILIAMFTLGASEAFVGPIGLALATRIAPERFTSQLVGLNFLALALGSSLSGLFGQLFTIISQQAYFLAMGATGTIVAVALFFSRKPIDRWLARGL